MTRRWKLQRWRVRAPLLFSLAVILFLAYLVFRYFLLTFAVAGSVALMLAPLQRSLTRRFRRRSIAAAVLVLLCTLVILVPVLSYATLLTQQAVSFFDWVRPQLQPAALEHLVHKTLPQRFPFVMSWLTPEGAPPSVSLVSEILSRGVSALNRFVQAALAQLAAAFLDLTLFLMMLFFLLRDGDQLRESLRGISPFTRGQETEVIAHLSATVKGVLQAMVLVPLGQGAVAVVGYWAFGLPAPMLWGVMTVFAALIPLVGSPLGWIPAALYFLFKGSMAKGIGMALYGILVISMIDNIVKPLILKGAAQIHTMLAFLSILGGVFAFGPKGLIVGPVVLSLVLSSYRIYRYDILRWREEEAARGPVDLAPEPAPDSVAAGADAS